MAISILAHPSQYHPAYNPVVYQVDSNVISSLTLPGFRYIFGIRFNGEATETIFKSFPDIDGFGTLDISKIIQSRIENTVEFGQSTALSSGENYIDYEISFGEEYPISWKFDDYSFDYFVQLDGTDTHSYVVGDQIIVRIDPSITDNRKVLNGTFNVVEVVNPTSIRINLLYTDLGDGPTTPGITYYSDRRKYTDYPQETQSKIAYNEAVAFKAFPTWSESDILPQDVGLSNEYLLTANILTNSPNAIDEFYSTLIIKDKDKYSVKTYQELYWNVMNNPVGDDSTTLANTMIAKNEFGDLWMLTTYDNNEWSDASIKIRQFNVSPNNLDWISITPNYDNTTGQPFMFNPYTHINADGSISQSKWIDIYPTFAPGNDECDEITGVIDLTPSIGSPTSTTFIARPFGTGTNQRRIYITTINDKLALLWQGIGSSPAFIRYWYISFIDEVMPQPGSINIIIPSIYQSFSTKTSNTLPFGTTSANNNDTDAWKAFDGDATTFWETNDFLEGGTLTYFFEGGARLYASVYSYTINKGTSITNAPKDWVVEGSTNGVLWDTLHTVSGSLTTGIYSSPIIWNGNQYRYVRLVVSAVISGLNLRVNEFRIQSTSLYSQLTTGSDCPVNTPARQWVFVGSAPGITSKSITTEGTGPVTYPTLKPRRIYMDYDCEINSTQLLFLDRSGSYSSFVFPLRVEEAGNSTKLSYKNQIGFVEDGQWTYNTYGGQWTYNTYDSESRVYNSSVEKTYKLTTDWLNTAMSDYFEELITSPEVYIKLNSEADNGRDGDGTVSPWLACTIIDSTFVNPKQRNKRLINRTVTVRANSNNPINI